MILITASLVACDKNRNTFMNRNYQNMVARFNVYFNGNERLDDAVKGLEKSHKDDYKQILEVYPYATEESRKSLSGKMDEIIKKASKIIADRPLSKWVDDAWLLQGKAYFFKADYFAAIENFQYINSKYKGTPISYEATLWIIKSYVFLNKSGEAEAIIGLMNNDSKFPEKLKPFLSEISAAVYIRQGKYKLAAENMEKALARAKGSAQRARYHYILGQLYDKLGVRDKAREHFKTVTKGAPPYEMAFNAKVNLARNYNPQDKGEVRAARRYLKSMLRDDKNINFYDQIYYELGVIEKRENNPEQALADFKASNNHNKGNADQKALSYLAIADIYFAQPKYDQAQLYYDSAVNYLKPEFENYDKLKAKQEVLTDLIKNLILIQREDSLLKVAKLPMKEIDRLVDKAIENEKEQERLRKEQEEELKRQQANRGNPMMPGNPFQPTVPVIAGGGFYFDDQANVARGYTEFLNRWGRRKNVDNWQFKSIADESQAINTGENKGDDGNGQDNAKGDDNKGQENELPDSIAPEKALYYKDIPFSAQAQSSSQNRIAEAMLNVGEIYYEALKEFQESQSYLNQYLTRFPKHEQKPKALYYSYKVATELGDAAQADKSKAELLSKYPESSYAKYLSESSVKQVEENPENKAVSALYQKAYSAHQQKAFAEVLSLKAQNDKQYFGSYLQPKFELLEAVVYGEIDSTERCIKELENVTLTYASTPEALTATRMLNAYKKKLAEDKMSSGSDSTAKKQSYQFNPNSKHYFMLLLPAVKGKLNLNNVKAKISDFNAKQKAGTSYAIDDLFASSRQFVLVKEFSDAEEAKAYLSLFQSDKAFLESLGLPEYELFVMDAQNVGLMVVNSDLEGFKSFYKNYYSK
ncbi:MAG: tetratricopeptide repeat protein [Bacteroidetes bacterium]|nr:MAG: tetratricopeptide repeat protein [Bacteroidota bacterium]